MRDKLLMHVRHTGQYCRCCDRPRSKTGIRRREKQQWMDDYLDESTPNPRR